MVVPTLIAPITFNNPTFRIPLPIESMSCPLRTPLFLLGRSSLPFVCRARLPSQRDHTVEEIISSVRKLKSAGASSFHVEMSGVECGGIDEREGNRWNEKVEGNQFSFEMRRKCFPFSYLHHERYKLIVWELIELQNVIVISVRSE